MNGHFRKMNGFLLEPGRCSLLIPLIPRNFIKDRNCISPRPIPYRPEFVDHMRVACKFSADYLHIRLKTSVACNFSADYLHICLKTSVACINFAGYRHFAGIPQFLPVSYGHSAASGIWQAPEAGAGTAGRAVFCGLPGSIYLCMYFQIIRPIGRKRPYYVQQ